MTGKEDVGARWTNLASFQRTPMSEVLWEVVGGEQDVLGACRAERRFTFPQRSSKSPQYLVLAPQVQNECTIPLIYQNGRSCSAYLSTFVLLCLLSSIPKRSTKLEIKEESLKSCSQANKIVHSRCTFSSPPRTGRQLITFPSRCPPRLSRWQFQG